MELSGPSITEVQGLLLAMQKNLECPICLEVMKEPVSTKCAHIFCRFCVFKLLSQKKGVTQCPLCNTKVTKRSLWEDVRFKQVIEGVLETICAFEHDTGLKFADEQCFPKTAIETVSSSAPWKNKSVIDSKGYRNRLKSVKERKKENTTLENSSLPLANGSVTRNSLRKKRNSSKAIVLEIGSDSSEDLLKKAGAVRCVGFGSSSLSQDGDGCAKKQSPSLCHMKFSEPSVEDVAPLDILGACDFMEEGLGSTEIIQVNNTRNSEVVEESVAVEKSHHLSFPDPCMQQHDKKSNSSPIQEDGSCSLLSRELLLNEATKPTADAGHCAEMVGDELTAGSAQICSIPCEDNEQLLQSQDPPDSPLSQVSGKRLRRSIQKVNEWLCKSKGTPSPRPLQGAQTEELVQDLDSFLLDAGSHVSQKTGHMKDLGEFIVEYESDKLLSKPVVSKIEDKIFGRTYKRERKSAPLRNEKETIQIPAEEGIATNTKFSDTPIRKILMRKRKATSELTPEDFIRRQDMKANGKRPHGDEDTSLEEGGQISPVGRSSVAKQKRAMLPAESVKETGVSKQTRSRSLPESSLCDSKNLKKKTNYLSRRSRHTVSRIDAKEPGDSIYHKCKAEIQIDSYPSSEEPRDVVTGHVQVRRSKRLQLCTEEARRRSEPAKRGRNQVDDGDKGEKQKGSQEEKTLSPPSIAEEDPILLRDRQQKGMLWSDASLVGMEDDASKACTNPATPPDVLEVAKSSLSVEQRIEGCSPCPIVPNTNFQGICSLPQFHSKVEQTTFEDKQFITTPQPEKNGLRPEIPETDGFCTGEVMESCKTPKAGDKAAGTLELNPETDDSELDTGFVQKIFSRCTRQSFLLHPSPIKEPAAEIQRKLSIRREEDSKIGCVTKSTQDKDRIHEERGDAAACEVTKDISAQSLVSCTSSFPEQDSGTEHPQVASEVLSPDCPSTPVGAGIKNAKGKSQLQSQKLASEKGASPELGRETSNTNRGSKSPSDCSKTNFQDNSLNSINETNASTGHFQETGPEVSENKRLAFRSQPESMHLHRESCQQLHSEFRCIHAEKVNSTMEQATDSSSPGVPKCLASGDNFEQSFDEEFHNFPLLLETPKSLHGSAVKSKEASPNLWGMGRKDVLAAFAKTEQTPHGRELDSSNSSKPSKCEGLVRTRRRLVKKLPSSEEEDSSEDEELPCFQALIFGQLASTALQIRKEKETPVLSSNSRSNPKSEDEDAFPSQQSGCSVNLFSSQSHASEVNSPKRCDSKFITPAPTSSVSLASPGREKNATQPKGRVSRDAGQLKDGHQEHVNAEPNLGEEAMDYDSEASYLGDSSGLSSQSETLTTQQREFMQNNLKKLQQKMAILEAVLKEGSQSTAPKELPLICKEPDFAGEQTVAASVAQVLEANSENLKTSNLKEFFLEGGPATPDNPATSKDLEPVVQQLQDAGSTAKLRSGSKQRILADFTPAGSVQGIPNSFSASSSRSEGHTSLCLATGAAKKSPLAMQDTDKSSAARHQAQEEPGSSLVPIACCSAGNGKLKSPLLTCKRNMTLVASGLNQGELRLVQKFAKKTGSTWSNQITEETTHVVMKTDEDLVCERTLKYFLGIAARKWVVSYHWIIQSLKKGRVLNEVDFEVKGDVINGRSHQGPKRARESPAGKLFQGLEICCYGPFTDMLSEQLEWMVELCGASLVKQPHLFGHATNSAAVVVVQPDAWVEVAACQEILLQCGATVVAREWVLDSVACYQRQMFDEYVVQLV